MNTRSVLIAVFSAAALVVAGVASASADREPRRYTAADQALARSIVLKQSDLGPSSTWHGGPVKPDTSPAPSCPNFHPRDSDLVVSGEAESGFKYAVAGLGYESQVQVLQTPRMVRLDWARTVEQPAMIGCLGSVFSKQLQHGDKLVAMTRLQFPKIATETAAFRMTLDVHTAGTQVVRFVIDTVLVGRGRTELTLTATAPYADAALLAQSEVRLARLLAARMPAS